MKGTQNDAKRPIDLIPPIITTPVSNARAMPVVSLGILKELIKILAVAFACTIFPAPNAAKTVNIAKKHPNHRFPKPLAR